MANWAEGSFSASAIPIIKVMETPTDAKDDLGSLDVKALIDTFKDSLVFTGNSNTNMVKIRRDCMKQDLPRHMQRLCSDSIDHSSSFFSSSSLAMISILPSKMCLSLTK